MLRLQSLKPGSLLKFVIEHPENPREVCVTCWRSDNRGKNWYLAQAEDDTDHPPSTDLVAEMIDLYCTHAGFTNQAARIWARWQLIIDVVTQMNGEAITFECTNAGPDWEKLSDRSWPDNHLLFRLRRTA